MSWVALAVGTVTAVGGAVAQHQQQKKAASAQANAANGINFGEKPKAAEYMPISFNSEQLAGILGNLRNTDDANQLMSAVNLGIDRDALTRARKFIPNYETNMRLTGSAATDLLNGRLPYDDVLGIVADRSELSNSLGTPGGSTNASLRDLGLSRLDAIKSGSGLMAGMVNLAEQINPVNRRMRPQDSLINPTDRIKMAMEQSQLIQASTQNKYNIRAGLSPAEQARSQLQLQSNLTSANNQFDWASIIKSVGGGVANAYASGAMGGGGYDMSADPQLVRGSTGTYYSRPPAGGYGRYPVPKLSDNYSIPV